uniref:Uncharacterized protein n=1 Tax=Plectus sambesii TaxID=2011161 RepID=A0A914UV26_9BILA
MLTTRAHQLLLLRFACRRVSNWNLYFSRQTQTDALSSPTTSNLAQTSSPEYDENQLIKQLSRDISKVKSGHLKADQWLQCLTALKNTTWRWNTALVTSVTLHAVNKRNESLLSAGGVKQIGAADFAAMLLFYKRWRDEKINPGHNRQMLVRWMEANVPKLSREDFFTVVRANGFYGSSQPAVVELIKTRCKELIPESSPFDLVRFMIAMKLLKVPVDGNLYQSIIDRVQTWRWDSESASVLELNDCLRLLMKKFDGTHSLDQSFVMPTELTSWLGDTVRLPFQLAAYSDAKAVAFTTAVIHSEQAKSQLVSDDELTGFIRQIVSDLKGNWRSTLLNESSRKSFLVFLLGITAIGNARQQDPLKYFDVDANLDEHFWKSFWIEVNDVMEQLSVGEGLQLLRRVVYHTASHGYQLASTTAVPSTTHEWIEPFFNRIQRPSNIPLTVLVLCCPLTTPKSVIRKISYQWRDMDWSNHEEENGYPWERQKLQLYQLAETYLNKLRQTASW